MALECGHDLRVPRRRLRETRAVAEAGELPLQSATWARGRSALSAVPSAIGEGSTHRPTPAAARRPQGNFSPGSCLRSGAMSECASTRSNANVAARHDVAAERDDGVDLRIGKIAVAEFMSRIDDLDADRARVDIGDAFPRRSAAVPGAPRFRHELIDAAVFVDEIVRGDFAAGSVSRASASSAVLMPV